VPKRVELMFIISGVSRSTFVGLYIDC